MRYYSGKILNSLIDVMYSVVNTLTICTSNINRTSSLHKISITITINLLRDSIRLILFNYLNYLRLDSKMWIIPCTHWVTSSSYILLILWTDFLSSFHSQDFSYLHCIQLVPLAVHYKVNSKDTRILNFLFSTINIMITHCHQCICRRIWNHRRLDFDRCTQWFEVSEWQLYLM